MNFIKTQIADLTLLKPQVFYDERGCFFESYNAKLFKAHGIDNDFVQDNQSSSSFGVIRGLHCQLRPYAQAKLIRVLSGKILDVALDVRERSTTFGKYESFVLSSDNLLQLFVPRGFLHGFAVLSEQAIIAYKTDNFYCKEAEFTLRYDCADLKIDWRLPQEKIVVSDKDLNCSARCVADLFALKGRF